ncbi:pyruvate dehydrogenase (quinone) [Diaminobutyricimonas aerilata]|uniref:Pyruvate dehydrogenase (Quinone) n=1 Tax=Diaminobutyricimonas aerilata TaxID=1162967 RepID=A0A2M9CK33_9MICO|nr:thiamine pyrophosphate-requiring protein [Diaminobutyricimonas aerilata]PJJ72254.1 pyruvate dehydrogenase (quinone) [Diaminobutyricimonas aerilata]
MAGERTVSDALIARLHEWGVDRVFGYSGDGINGVMGALRRSSDVEFVQARHEESAAFMAVGHAKFTGRLGVVTSTQGPGAVHLLTGLYDAKLDHVPVVAIVGQQKTSVLGSGYMQEIDLQHVFADVAAQFVQTVASAEQVPMVVDRAVRAAFATRSPAVVIIPHDIQQEPEADLPHEHGVIATAVDWRPPRVLPHDDDVRQAVDVLTAGSRPMLLVGQGAAGARDEVVRIAERLGAGIVTSLLGKPHVDETLPFAAGTMGHLGTTASGQLLSECDTLLIVGCDSPWTEFYPPPGAARAVQIDIDGRRMGDRYPIEVGLVGDAALTLQALERLLDEAPARVGEWRDTVELRVREWRQIRDERAATPAAPINPERVTAELRPLLPGDAMVAVDVGSCAYWYARQLDLPAGASAHISGTLASMGCAVPYGIAAKLAAPDRPVVALAGDGATQMLGLAELVTLSRLWTRWTDPRFVLCVFDNGDLAEVSWEQREMEQEPRFEESQALPSVPYARYAELLGMHGIEVDDPVRLAEAWREALDADRPTVLHVHTDPAVPLLPPFPGGAAKLAGMRDALRREGDAAVHALELLELYAGHESSRYGG